MKSPRAAQCASVSRKLRSLPGSNSTQGFPLKWAAEPLNPADDCCCSNDAQCGDRKLKLQHICSIFPFFNPTGGQIWWIRVRCYLEKSRALVVPNSVALFPSTSSMEPSLRPYTWTQKYSFNTSRCFARSASLPLTRTFGVSASSWYWVILCSLVSWTTTTTNKLGWAVNKGVK